MIASVTDHYAKHLGPIYSWMVGDFEQACAQADTFYTRIGLIPGDGAIAVDLGCGHGVHSVPLARRGYRVVAIDNCTHLLTELASAKGDLPIRIVSGDLSSFASLVSSELASQEKSLEPPRHALSPGPRASLIVCMGDTVTHLPSVKAVDTLIRDAVRCLMPGGLLGDDWTGGFH